MRLDERYWRKVLGGAWSRGWRPTLEERRLHEAHSGKSVVRDPRARLDDAAHRRELAGNVGFTQALSEARAADRALSAEVEAFYSAGADDVERAMARIELAGLVRTLMRQDLITEVEALAEVVRQHPELYRRAYAS